MAKHSQVEYVYNFGNDFEFRKVLVEIHVEETRVMLNVIPDSMMIAEELDVMLKGFNTEVLSQMRFSLEADCAVEISFGGKTYGVEFAERDSASSESSIIKRIIPA